jgi:adenylate kinase
MIAVIFGIQGVGKSTLVRMVIEQFPEETWNLLQIGNAMMDLCLKKGIIRIGNYDEICQGEVQCKVKKHDIAIVKDGREEIIYVKDQTNLQFAKDEIRNLNLATQKKLQDEIALYYQEMMGNDPDGNYIIETHAALKTKQGYLPGLSKSFLNSLSPDVYIIIEANADEIFVRRLLDKERKREHDKTTKDVQTNLDTTRYFASAFAAQTHSPLLIVENKEKRAAEAAVEIMMVLQKFLE